MSEFERDDFEITPELLANFSDDEDYGFYDSYESTPFEDCAVEEKSIEQIREERYRRQEQRKLNKRKARRSAFINYLMPSMALILLVSTVCYMNSLQFGLVVSYNDEQLGVVENASVLQEATSLIDSRIINKSLDSLENEPQYRVAVVNNTSDFTNSTELSRSIIANDNLLADELCGVFVDDTFVGSVISEEEAQEVLDGLLEAKKKASAELGDVQKVEFNSSVSVEVGLYAKDSVIDKVELKNRLENNVEISYKITVLQEQNVKIRYKTTYKADNSKPSGYEKVTTKGQIGEGVATNESIYIDNEKISSEHVKVTATKKPVNEVITVSADDERLIAQNEEEEKKKADASSDSEKKSEAKTEEKAKSSDKDTDKDNKAAGSDTDKAKSADSDTDTTAASGDSNASTKSEAPDNTEQPTANSQFIWPAQGGITCGFGYDEGDHLHKGIDIGAGEGTPVLASASGTVVSVVEDYSNEGLGCYIVIDHGNGYQTTYAQCSAIYAAYGQHVEQGEAIASVGSTGDSTGPHLHFRISENGAYTDPANFLY